tara:strand:- start:85 stop:237 length:153 start_codon:yes stop_codon:yes gene_type:complete
MINLPFETSVVEDLSLRCDVREPRIFTATTRASNGAKESMIAVKAKTAKP